MGGGGGFLSPPLVKSHFPLLLERISLISGSDGTLAHLHTHTRARAHARTHVCSRDRPA